MTVDSNQIAVSVCGTSGPCRFAHADLPVNIAVLKAINLHHGRIACFGDGAPCLEHQTAAELPWPSIVSVLSTEPRWQE